MYSDLFIEILIKKMVLRQFHPIKIATQTFNIDYKVATLSSLYLNVSGLSVTAKRTDPNTRKD